MTTKGISIYDALKKSNKFNVFSEVNYAPYSQLHEFSHLKALIYSKREIVEYMSENIKIYEIDHLLSDITKLLNDIILYAEFERIYSKWNISIPMLAQPFCLRLSKALKNGKFDRQKLYYLGINLASKSSNIPLCAIGILILSQFQNDISEDILYTLSKHARLLYYCLIAVSDFNNSERITLKILNSCKGNGNIIASLSIDYSSISFCDWLINTAILEIEEPTTIAFYMLTNGYFKQYLSNMQINAKNFSSVTRMTVYALSHENLLKYSRYDTNFLSEWLIKLLVNTKIEYCKSATDYWFLINIMNIISNFGEYYDKIDVEIEKLLADSSQYTEEDLSEIKRNFIKDKIFVSTLIHIDFLKNIFTMPMESKLYEFDEESMQKLIENTENLDFTDENSLNPQMNDILNTSYFNQFEHEIVKEYSNQYIYDTEEFRNKFDENMQDKKNVENSWIEPNMLYFNDHIQDAVHFTNMIFPNYDGLQKMIKTVKHSGNFKEEYKKIDLYFMDSMTSDLETALKSETFLDILLDDMQFVNNKPSIYLEILALFNIIPEFPYFDKILEDYPLSFDILDYFVNQFEYYNDEISDYILKYIEKRNLSTEELIFTNQDVKIFSEAISIWINRIFSAYMESENIEINYQFICRTIEYFSENNFKNAVKILKKQRDKLSFKQNEILYYFIKRSTDLKKRKSIAAILDLNLTQIRNSSTYSDAIKKYKANKNGSIIHISDI